jgi:hypothetical protein
VVIPELNRNPDPAKRASGESPQEASRLLSRALAESFTRWAGISTAEAVPTITAFCNYLRLVERGAETGGLVEQRDAAVELLDPIIGAGLTARLGRCLLPDAIIPGHVEELTADHRAWQTIELCLALLNANPTGICVCASCTMVFKPARKARAQRCSLCEKRPAAPPLGSVLPEGGHPGEPMKRGQTIRVREPTWRGTDRGPWRVATIGLSGETGEVFIGRSDKRGSSADRKKRARRTL